MLGSPLSVLEVLEGQVLDISHKVILTRVEGQLLEHLNEHQAEEKLHGQIPPLHCYLSIGSTRHFSTAQQKSLLENNTVGVKLVNTP